MGQAGIADSRIGHSPATGMLNGNGHKARPHLARDGGSLARCAQHKNAIDPAFHQVVDHPAYGRFVKFALRGNRGYHRHNDAVMKFGDSRQFVRVHISSFLLLADGGPVPPSDGLDRARFLANVIRLCGVGLYVTRRF